MFNEDVLKEFLFDCKIRKLSDRTIKGYKNNNLKMFGFIKQEYGIIELEEINHIAIRGYLEYLTNLGLKETYINTLIKSFRAFFKYCVKENYINRNPMDRIYCQKEPITLINTFTDEEVSRMIKFYSGSKFLDVRNQLIMVILFDTGMRNSELCELKMTDIRDTYFKIMGKGNKERHVPITPAINKVLIKYLRVRENYINNKINYDTEYLLLSQKGKKLTKEAVENIVRYCGTKCRVREGIRISPHTCRHYYAQSLLKNGCDLFTVSRLLGHSNINVTKRYLQSIQEDDTLELGIKTSPLSNLKGF